MGDVTWLDVTIVAGIVGGMWAILQRQISGLKSEVREMQRVAVCEQIHKRTDERLDRHERLLEQLFGKLDEMADRILRAVNGRAGSS